nr:MAG TPA: hypothetical protein [Bacteriophage sp.]
MRSGRKRSRTAYTPLETPTKQGVSPWRPYKTALSSQTTRKKCLKNYSSPHE